MAALLQVESLKKTFFTRNAEVEVLKDVSFSVNSGEIVLVNGRSGEGKSTLLAIIAGLEKASGGKISFNGLEITAMSLTELAELRASSIGIIFQSFNLIPTWTAIENVEAVLMHRGLSATVRAERASAILTKLGLQDRLNNLPDELSVGQQQRVAVARTLVNEPSMILADEPTGDVDKETAAEIMSLLLPSVKEKGASMLVASHGSFAASYADRIFTLQSGHLLPARSAGGDVSA